MRTNRSCSAGSTASSYGLDPEIDRIIGTMDLDGLDLSEEALMREALATHIPNDVEAFLPLFMGLSQDKRALYLFDQDVCRDAVDRARVVLRSQGRFPAPSVPPTPGLPTSAGPVSILFTPPPSFASR